KVSEALSTEPQRIGMPSTTSAASTTSQGPRRHDWYAFRSLVREGERAAGALARLGVKAGDPVAVLLPMCLESVAITLACVNLSAVRLTLPVGGHSGLIRHRVHGSGTRLVVTADACQLDGQAYGVKTALDRALVGCPGVERVLVVRQLARPVPWQPGRDQWWHEVLAHGGLPPRPYPGHMSDLSRSGGTPPTGPSSDLDFGDPLDRPSSDDNDRGWGDDGPAEDASVADLARFLNEKPPHHL
ncbi:AMP-binding protein, partial [Streptomyces sp. SBT349]|uniref:AMP-binding protein n=1 Tax=Streptomyces sp. SBT349 TaxID=1580539 RepID=UPI0007C734E4